MDDASNTMQDDVAQGFRAPHNLQSTALSMPYRYYAGGRVHGARARAHARARAACVSTRPYLHRLTAPPPPLYEYPRRTRTSPSTREKHKLAVRPAPLLNLFTRLVHHPIYSPRPYYFLPSPPPHLLLFLLSRPPFPLPLPLPPDKKKAKAKAKKKHSMAMVYAKMSPLPTAASLSSCSTLPPASTTRLDPLSLDAPSSARSRRLPKAPVFISRKPPEPNTITSFVTDSDLPDTPIRMEEPATVVESRVYDFDDDFPSIAASESTAPPPDGPIARRTRERIRRRDLFPTSSSINTPTMCPSSPLQSSSCIDTPLVSHSNPNHASNINNNNNNTNTTTSTSTNTANVNSTTHIPRDRLIVPRARARSRSRSRARTRSRSRRRDGASGGSDVLEDDDSQLIRRRRFRDVDDDFARHVLAAAPTGGNGTNGTSGTNGTNGEGVVPTPGIQFTRTGATSFANSDRLSFASSIRRRVSLHYNRPRGDGANPNAAACGTGAAPRRSFGGASGHRAQHLEDSILHDWRESRMKDAAAAASGTNCNPGHGRRSESGCTGFFQSLFQKVERRAPAPESSAVRLGRCGNDNSGGGVRCTTLVEDRKKSDDVQLISALAYDDFMYGQSPRPSAASRVLSRLRRT